MKTFALLVASSFSRGGAGLSVMATAVFFASLVVSLFALALGVQPQVQQLAAPAILWLVTLLAALLSLEPLWHRDAASGRFDLLLLSGLPPAVLAGAVLLAHWLSAGLPLVLAALPLALMLQLPVAAIPVIMAALVLGTIYLSLIGGAGALLTYGARQPGVLLVLLVLPLMVPMLLLGLLATEAAITGLEAGGINPYLLWQAALVLVALPCLSWLAAVLLRQQFFR